MDKRQLITATLLSVLVCAIWVAGNMWWEKHHPAPPPTADTTTQPANAVNNAAPATNTSETQPTTRPASADGQNLSAGPIGLHAVAATQPGEPAVLGSAAARDPNYAMEVVFSALGAGVERVTLNDFPAPVDPTMGKSSGPYQFEEPGDDPAATRVLATRQIVVNGKVIDLSSIAWNKSPVGSDAAQFYIDIDDASGHVAKVTKTYHIEKRNAADGSKGYELAVTQEIADERPDAVKSTAPLSARWVINGPVSPPSELDQGGDRAVVSTTVESPNVLSSVEQNLLAEFKPEDMSAGRAGEPAAAPTQDPAKSLFTRPVAWVGQTSAYFGALALPATPGSPGFNTRATAVKTNADREPTVTLSFESPNVAIDPANGSAISMTVFFGPKWRDVLKTPHYASYPRQYSQLLEYRSKMCAWCTSSTLISALVWLLGIFHSVFHDWGVSIICLVLCVRALLHPLTKRAQVKMMGMSKLSPEIEKLKKKYADQPDVLNKEMMKIYKEQGGAILGCLPMFLQTPIWIALWSALQGTFELRQAPFLEVFGHHLTWVKDLAKPDALIHFSSPVPLMIMGWHLYSINVLPLAMAVVTYINQKYFMPIPPAATPEQEQQQKMQRGMSIFFPLMFYALPSGLNLYYLTSTSLGIIESKIIRDHIKEQEELAKSQRELVPTKGTRASRRKDGKEDEPVKPSLMGRLMEAMEKAQQRAEEMRKESQKGKKKG